MKCSFKEASNVLSCGSCFFLSLIGFAWVDISGASRVLPSDQTEHLEIIQRRRSSARLARTEIVKETSKKSLKLFEEVEMEMRSEMEEK